MTINFRHCLISNIKHSIAHYAGIVLVGILLSSCNSTRHFSSGEYLLRKVDIVVAHADYDSIEIDKADRITAKDLEKYQRQAPNKRLLGTNIPLGIYSTANPSKNNWWNDTRRRIGSSPVIFDPVLAENSTEAMKIYMDSRGYLKSDVSYRVDTTGQKAKLTYYARTDLPYTIASLNYDFRDDFLKGIILEDTASSLIRAGDLFDSNVLAEERNRITAYLKDRGYFDFTVNNISFSIDTVSRQREVGITMIVRQYEADAGRNGETILDNNKVYRIKDIYVYPDYDPSVMAGDPAYRARLDTIYYKGLHIVYEDKPRVRKEIIRSAVNLFPNSLYDASQVRRTYNNLMLLGYYRSANIQFRQTEPDTLLSDNRIIYIGDPAADLSSTAVPLTEEGYLTGNIYLSPQKKQSITTEFEGTMTSDYFGLILRLGYQNRNIFRGAELLDIGLRGGYEFLRNNNTGKSSFEIGGTANVTFPRFIAPFGINRYNRIYNPKTRAEIAYNAQQRPYYNRTISSAIWGYSWGNGRNSSFILRPVDINVINMGSIDPEFLADISSNPYLENSYKSQVIAGLSGSYIFNNQLRNINNNSTTLRVNYETNGNLIYGLFNIFQGHSDTPYKLFGTPFAQYFRVDANISHRIALGERSSLVYRFYGGWANNYGNGRSIPFDRFFYSGGLNSMRGWVSRTLGPGNTPEPTDVTFPRQVGNIKLETNLEARFPIWGIVNGAVFFDAGNIWWARRNMLDGSESEDPKGLFELNTFYKQLGFNTGLGVRLDFNLFVFRLDWGLQLHNPNKPAGQRWIQTFGTRNSTLNFGVGYPF